MTKAIDDFKTYCASRSDDFSQDFSEELCSRFVNDTVLKDPSLETAFHSTFPISYEYEEPLTDIAFEQARRMLTQIMGRKNGLGFYAFCLSERLQCIHFARSRKKQGDALPFKDLLRDQFENYHNFHKLEYEKDEQGKYHTLYTLKDGAVLVCRIEGSPAWEGHVHRFSGNYFPTGTEAGRSISGAWRYELG